jgi:peroxiredoxin
MRAMRCPPRCVLLAFAVTLTVGTVARPGDDRPVQVGKKIDAFALKDIDGKTRALADFQEKKVVVVVFVGTQCPINNLFMPRLVELHDSYAEKGVQFVAINANRHDTPEAIAEHARKHKLPFPVLRDPGNQVADRFGAERVPEAFVLDGDRVVRYQGRIDDQYGIGYQRAQPTRRDLALAIDEVLAGKKVSVAAAPAAGCHITRVAAPLRAEATVTYAQHVSRILQNRCQECHRPGQIGPMPLLTYDDASAWAATIKEVVEERRMPPWHADPKHGKFSNDRSLSAEDRAALLTWIKQGCPKGDNADLPKPRVFVDGWTIGKPDRVFTMSQPFTVPAKVSRQGIRYQQFYVKTNFEQDVWVSAAEAKPGNPAVVHHIIVYVLDKGKRNGFDIGDGFLVGFAPGDIGVKYPAGAAKKIPKGATLMFQMHYTPNGTEQKDQSSVGLVFAKEPPKNEVKTRAISNFFFQIPPGAAKHQVKSATSFSRDARLWSLLPHMHLRGKSFEYQLVYPDGKREVLLSVPRYDFAWQATYFPTEPKFIPAGSRIECTAYFDNSANNPNNPDPRASVRFGEQTWEEMMIGFIDFSYVEAKK